MADNVAITQGAGTTVATDDIAGVQHQRVKLVWGVDGAGVDASATNPFPTTNAVIGAAADAAWVSGDGTLVALLKNVVARLVALQTQAESTTDVETNDSAAQALLTSILAKQPTAPVAHDAADTGEPVKVGARARSSEIAPVANNDRADFITDLTGKHIVLPYANPENFVSGAITSAMTGTTSTSLVAAPAAGLRNYLTTIVVSNAHATVGTDVVIQDGSGGTTLMTIPAAAVYGGAVITLPTPLRQPTTATAIFCANVTTGASTKVSAVGYKGA